MIGTEAVAGGGGSPAPYVTKIAAFTAVAYSLYALDTTNGSFDVTIDAALPVGGYIDFFDAEGTWNTYLPTFRRNGHLLEGAEVDYTDGAQGTFLRIVNAGGNKGLRILESGTKPNNLVAPVLSGGNNVGSLLSLDTGLWTGTPTAFFYQWQVSVDGVAWTNIVAATGNTYHSIADYVGQYIRGTVSAANANGASIPVASNATDALVIPAFPLGATAYWRMDEEIGVRADATGNGFTLSDDNNTGFVAGIIGNAAQFIAGNGNRLGAASCPYTITDSLTFSAWVKVVNIAQTGIIVGDGYMSGGYIYLYQNKVWFSVDNQGRAGDVSAEITLDEWVHVVGTFDAGTGATALWINGVKMDEGSGAIMTVWSGYTGLEQFYLGKENGGGNAFDGLLDEVGIWTRALSDVEISVLYNGGAGVSYPA